MTRTLPDDLKIHWPQHLSTLLHAYNCTRSNATSYIPFFLMYGRHPLLPIDNEFGVFSPDTCETATHKYVQKLKSRLEFAYRKAKEIMMNESKRAKQRYDQKIRCSKLKIGDLVLVRKKAFSSKHKIFDRWENDISI